MKIFKRNKAYVSPIDLFQAEFDKTHPKSASQIAEIEKHRKVFLKRDKKPSATHDLASNSLQGE